MFILFFYGITEIHKILGLREGVEEDHTAANLVNEKRSSENLVPNNQNKQRVVNKKTEIFYINTSKYRRGFLSNSLISL